MYVKLKTLKIGHVVRQEANAGPLVFQRYVQDLEFL